MSATNPILLVVMVVSALLMLPLLSYWLTGEFTFDFEGAMERKEMRVSQEEYDFVREGCPFGVMQTEYGFVCDYPCVRMNTDGRDCVEKGCVNTGFLSSECGLYVCDDGVELVPQCVEYWYGSREEYCSVYNRSRYCEYSGVYFDG